MRNWRIIGIIIVLAVLLDFYVFQIIKSVSQGASPRAKMIGYGIYWGLSVCALIGFALLPLLSENQAHPRLRNYIRATVAGLFFAKLLAAVFFLVDDIRRLFQWAAGKMFFEHTEGASIQSDGISRSAFLNWVGLGIGATFFSTFIHGF